MKASSASSPSSSPPLLQSSELLVEARTDVFDRAARLAREALNTPISVLALLHGNEVRYGATEGIDPAPCPISASICKRLIDAGEPAALFDLDPEDQLSRPPVLQQKPDVQVAMGTPLLVTPAPSRMGPSAAVGALYTADTASRNLSAADRSVLRDLAAMVEEELERQLSSTSSRPSSKEDATSQDVENTLRERERKVEALYEETKNLLQSDSPGEVAARLEALVIDTLEYPLNAVRFAEGDVLAPARISDAIPAHMPDRPEYPISGDSVVAQVYRTGQTRLFKDIQDVDDAHDRGQARATAYVSIGQHGTISVASLQPNAIQPFDLRLLEILAGNAAVVLDRIQRETRQQRTIDRIETLRNLSQAILSATSTEDVAETTLQRLSALVPYDQASVLECPPEEETITLLTIDDHEALSDRVTEARLLRHFQEDGELLREPRYVEEIPESSPDPVERYLYDRGLRSYVNVPLKTDEDVIGFLNLGAYPPSAYRSEHVEIASEVADMLTVALRQARYREQLIEAKEEAEQMNQLKSAFLANMSHEIRSPLTSIVGFAEILDDYDLGEANRFADLIEQSGSQLLDTIDSVLDLSKLEAGAVRPNFELTEAVQEVRSVVELVSPRAQEAGLTLHTEFPSPPVEAELDPSAFRRILRNLLSNAVKFTNAGGSVQVRMQATADRITVAIKDTGRGIDEAFLPNLFDPFEQESTPKAGEHDGTGLGLAVTKRLVELLEGSIEVDSTKGEGTCFTVHFPRTLHSDS